MDILERRLKRCWKRPRIGRGMLGLPAQRAGLAAQGLQPVLRWQGAQVVQRWRPALRLRVAQRWQPAPRWQVAQRSQPAAVARLQGTNASNRNAPKITRCTAA